MARQNGSGLLKQSGRGIRILGRSPPASLRPADKRRFEVRIQHASTYRRGNQQAMGQLGRQSNGPAVVVRSTSPQLSPGLALLTWDAGRWRRAIDGLTRSGIVEIHAVHLT